MYDQLIIGDKNSYDDFGASLASRKIDPPAKKKVRETIPFSNITYDFSKINGEFYYDDRNLEYTLEMTAETPQELEDMKTALSDWIMNVFQEELHDPFIPDYHFIATYDDLSFSDDEGMNKTTATAKFTAYPYKIANAECEYTINVPSLSLIYTSYIVNNSSHPVTATLLNLGEYAVEATIDGKTITLWDGGNIPKQVKLKSGEQEIVIASTYKAEIKVTFTEEVL